MKRVGGRTAIQRVVAVAAEQELRDVAETAIKDVVAAVAPDRVAAAPTRCQLVIKFGAAQNDGVAKEVFVTGELYRPVGQYVDQ